MRRLDHLRQYKQLISESGKRQILKDLSSLRIPAKSAARLIEYQESKNVQES
jgi:hypothetical protein